jgi:cytochrome c-type biogenesis protein CcsB
MIESWLGNASFLIFFFSMCFFWINASFYFNNDIILKNATEGPLVEIEKTNRSFIFNNSNIATPGNPFFIEAIFKHQLGSAFVLFLGNFGMLISNILLFSLLVIRWKESGHFPLSNLYESLMFLSWCCTVIHFLLIFQKTDVFNYAKKKATEPHTALLGCITSPSALFTNAFASLCLPLEMQKTAPLVPALQSNWLMMHVTSMIISYSVLIIGSLISIAFLMVTQGEDLLSPVLEKSALERSPALPKMLDNLSYRILGLGFPFLTVGILSGAVWANESWGSYWSWDPKETWALLTWLIFAIYLHTRLVKGWQGKKPAIIASLGFLVVWICYLGVNLIGEGLHSYGWLTS